MTANIVADNYKRNIDDIIFGKMMVRSYGMQAEARILIIDENKNVVVDNYNSYVDRKLDNAEVRSSLEGTPKSGIYENKVLQLTVPITSNYATANEIIGIVLISYSLDQVNESINDMKNDIIKISSIALIISLILTTISATSITRSIRALAIGVEKLTSGQLGYTIKHRAKGEEGKLINTFNDMSEKLNRIEKHRKTMINSISHELRTPLTSISALIDSLLIGNNGKETYDEYLRDIKGEAERMGNLVKYLMESIKLEEMTLNLKDENLSDIIYDSVKLIAPYANKKDVIINTNIEENLIIKCDKDKIHEVFLNLIENAIKYRDINEEQSYVYITLKKDINNISIIIEDNGVGIDHEKLNKIFNRGFRVLDDTLTKTDGYGIGLFIVKNIIDRHNWNISIDSTKGIGTIFKIEIF